MSVDVVAKPLTADAFAPFGQIVTLDPGTPADGAGDGWQMWFADLELSADRHLTVGTVQTELRPVTFASMERHVETWELLYPHGGSLVQAVAAPHDLDDVGAVPDPDLVEAFVIHPGQAVLLAPGTWHAAAYPVAGTTTYTFVGQRLTSGPPVWVPFAAGRQVRVGRAAG